MTRVPVIDARITVIDRRGMACAAEVSKAAIMNVDQENDPSSKDDRDKQDEKHERHLERPVDNERQEEEERRYMHRFRQDDRKASSSHWGYKSWPPPEERQVSSEQEGPIAANDPEKRELSRGDDDREHSPTSTRKANEEGSANEDRAEGED